ncbi:MAG: hypothetical protein JNM79_20170 [Burkholderiales bacterium]|nr:hypothetical protein [Burkholderiales bacterium]
MPALHFPLLILGGPSRPAKAALLRLLLDSPAGERMLVIENEAGHVQAHALLAHGRDAGSVARIRPCACCLPAASWTATLRDATWRFSRNGVRQFDAVIVVASARADPALLAGALGTDMPAARHVGTLLALDDSVWLDGGGLDGPPHGALHAADWVWTGETGDRATRLFDRVATVHPGARCASANDLLRHMTNCALPALPAATA